MNLYESARSAAKPLNFIRLLLAIMVLYSHCFPLGGFGPNPVWPTLLPATDWGGVAVGAFFALSGFFVTNSAFHRPAGPYLVARVFRIFPGLLTVLILSATVLGPAVFVSSGGTWPEYWMSGQGGPIGYVMRNMFLPVGLQFGILDVFATTTPYGLGAHESVINGSLWTLPMEVRCYLVALLIAVVARYFGKVRTTVIFLAMTLALLFVNELKPAFVQSALPDFLPIGLFQLLFIFLCGALVAALSRKIRASHWVGLGGLCIFFVTSLAGGFVFLTFGLGSLAIGLPYIGSLLRRAPLGFFSNDLSYGVYIWAFPVQQLLAYFHWNRSFEQFVGLSLVITLVMAALSWWGIERPAINFAKRLSYLT